MDSPVALEIRVSDLTCALQEENSKLRTAFSMRNRLVQDHNRDTSHWAKKAILDLTSVIACLEATDSQLLSPIRLLSNRTADVCRISAILKRSYQNLRRCSEQAQNSFAKLDESTGKCLNAALSLDLKLTETTVSIQRIEVESKEIEDQVIRHLGHIVERAQNLQTRKSDSQQALSAMKKELVATTIEECKSLTKLGMYTFLALAFICSGETVTFLLGLLFMYLLVRSVREWNKLHADDILLRKQISKQDLQDSRLDQDHAHLCTLRSKIHTLLIGINEFHKQQDIFRQSFQEMKQNRQSEGPKLWRNVSFGHLTKNQTEQFQFAMTRQEVLLVLISLYLSLHRSIYDQSLGYHSYRCPRNELTPLMCHMRRRLESLQRNTQRVLDVLKELSLSNQKALPECAAMMPAGLRLETDSSHSQPNNLKSFIRAIMKRPAGLGVSFNPQSQLQTFEISQEINAIETTEEDELYRFSQACEGDGTTNLTAECFGCNCPQDPKITFLGLAVTAIICVSMVLLIEILEPIFESIFESAFRRLYGLTMSLCRGILSLSYWIEGAIVGVVTRIWVFLSTMLVTLPNIVFGTWAVLIVALTVYVVW